MIRKQNIQLYTSQYVFHSWHCQFISFSGDRVLEINGVNLEQYDRKQAVQLLRASPSPVRIILERYKGAGAQLDERAMSIEQDILKSSVCKVFELQPYAMTMNLSNYYRIFYYLVFK